MNQDRINLDRISRDRSDAGRSSINHLLATADLKPLDVNATARFEEYLALILRWNSRMNLTAIRDPEQILCRHFVESIACAQHLPEGIGSLLDFGSGAGFPGIPIALCRPEIAVTLAESQSKKAAFLQEIVRTLGLNVSVFAKRAELLARPFDCVTLRAVDRMEQAVSAAANLIGAGGRLAILTTRAQLLHVQKSAGPAFRWIDPFPIPGSDQRVMVLAFKAGSSS
ncbi:MAG: 16S rRNA (guanine(527)-N(7))-methyltransferase RsmG [Terracidiphilus sp.]